MPNLNPNPLSIPNTDTDPDAEYKFPKVSREQLALITGIKLKVQQALMEKEFGYLLKNDENAEPIDNGLIASWLSTRGKLIGDYFFLHPDATMKDIDKIAEFINRSEATEMH